MVFRMWEEPESVRALDLIADACCTVFAPKLRTPALSFALYLRPSVHNFMAQPRAAQQRFARNSLRTQTTDKRWVRLMRKRNPGYICVKVIRKNAVTSTNCVSFVGPFISIKWKLIVSVRVKDCRRICKSWHNRWRMGFVTVISGSICQRWLWLEGHM